MLTWVHVFSTNSFGSRTDVVYSWGAMPILHSVNGTTCTDKKLVIIFMNHGFVVLHYGLFYGEFSFMLALIYN